MSEKKRFTTTKKVKNCQVKIHTGSRFSKELVQQNVEEEEEEEEEDEYECSVKDVLFTRNLLLLLLFLLLSFILVAEKKNMHCEMKNVQRKYAMRPLFMYFSCTCGDS
jgi:hypothetical protein